MSLFTTFFTLYDHIDDCIIYLVDDFLILLEVEHTVLTVVVHIYHIISLRDCTIVHKQVKWEFQGTNHLFWLLCYALLSFVYCLSFLGLNIGICQNPYGCVPISDIYKLPYLLHNISFVLQAGAGEGKVINRRSSVPHLGVKRCIWNCS